MIEIADLLAEARDKQFYLQPSNILDLFMEYDVQKWHTIVSFQPEATCLCYRCSASQDLCKQCKHQPIKLSSHPFFQLLKLLCIVPGAPEAPQLRWPCFICSDTPDLG